MMAGDRVRKEDVKEYFGEFFNDEDAEKMAELAYGKSFFEQMNRIRDALIRNGYSVPFRAVYRRAK